VHRRARSPRGLLARPGAGFHVQLQLRRGARRGRGAAVSRDGAFPRRPSPLVIEGTAMQAIIVGHHARTEWVAQLQHHLPGAAAVIDYSDGGSLQGHHAALESAAQADERCVILEDVAIPVVGFAEHAARWCVEHPHDLISFYLGTGRPVAWQPRVDGAVEYTDTGFITLPR